MLDLNARQRLLFDDLNKRRAKVMRRGAYITEPEVTQLEERLKACSRSRKKNCNPGCEAAVSSFFPAKPPGCYGDGGAIFTDDEYLALKLCSR